MKRFFSPMPLCTVDEHFFPPFLNSIKNCSCHNFLRTIQNKGICLIEILLHFSETKSFQKNPSLR